MIFVVVVVVFLSWIKYLRTQDYQQKNKQITSNNKVTENGVDFSLLPYGSTRRAIATNLDGTNTISLDDDNKAIFINPSTSTLNRRLRKDATRYSSST